MGARPVKTAFKAAPDAVAADTLRLRLKVRMAMTAAPTSKHLVTILHSQSCLEIFTGAMVGSK